MEKEIINRVAQSSLITINPKDFLPKAEEYVLIDLKDFLFKEFILKEKDFRDSVSNLDLSKFENKAVGIFCSNEAIVPQWATMLLVAKLNATTSKIFLKNKEQLIEQLFLENVNNLEVDLYKDKPLIVKGCGAEVPKSAYLQITNKLLPVAKSLMYGEACSTVPIYKRPKNI